MPDNKHVLKALNDANMLRMHKTVPFKPINAPATVNPANTAEYVNFMKGLFGWPQVGPQVGPQLNDNTHPYADAISKQKNGKLYNKAVEQMAMDKRLQLQVLEGGGRTGGTAKGIMGQDPLKPKF